MFTPYRRYAEFNGRSTRTEYWLFALFYTVVYALCLALKAVSEIAGAIAILLFALATFIPSLAVAIRRLHDTDRTGWHVLWGFLPIVGSIVLLVFLCLPSAPGNKRFGPPDSGSVG